MTPPPSLDVVPAGPQTSPPGGGPAPCYWQRYRARLDHAREFLAQIGMLPQRVDRQALIPIWRVPGYTGLFDNSDLVALAEELGCPDMPEALS